MTPPLPQRLREAAEVIPVWLRREAARLEQEVIA